MFLYSVPMESFCRRKKKILPLFCNSVLICKAAELFTAHSPAVAFATATAAAAYLDLVPEPVLLNVCLFCLLCLYPKDVHFSSFAPENRRQQKLLAVQLLSDL